MNVEIQNRVTGTRSTLIVSRTVWPNRQPAKLIDPVRSNNQLALDLYQELITENDSNLILSPYSIFSATAMTYCGARGKTAEQMTRVLRLGRPEETPPAFAYLNLTLRRHEEAADIKLNIANGIWHQQDHEFRPQYLKLIYTFFGGKVQPADFKGGSENVRKEINHWVAEQTNDKITNLMAPGSLSPATCLALINAIYFKGDWDNKFEAYATRPAPFYLSDGTTNEVQMMAQKEMFEYGETEQSQILELPYKGKSFSMLVLLPKGNHTLKALEATLSINTLTGEKLREHEVRVKFPKFTIESSFGLSSIISKLGMPLAFDPQHADFSGISRDGPLGIDSAVHKAIITVGEKGTEAAAATGYTVFGGTLQRTEPKEFFADHPFLFLIRENATGTILFLGRVMSP